jgi:hypothetical protein
VNDDTIHVYSTAGFVFDFPVKRFHRNVRIVDIYERTSEIKESVIADPNALSQRLATILFRITRCERGSLTDWSLSVFLLYLLPR